MPVDLQEAGDDAEALLQATGYATFVLPGGFRFFRLPTERVNEIVKLIATRLP